MPPEIKLVISHNAKVVQTLKHALDEQGFVKSIEDFQILANATMTKLIEESGDIDDCVLEEDNEDSDNEDGNISLSPKRKKT